jgi:hypothetical protein
MKTISAAFCALVALSHEGDAQGPGNGASGPGNGASGPAPAPEGNGSPQDRGPPAGTTDLAAGNGKINRDGNTMVFQGAGGYSDDFEATDADAFTNITKGSSISLSGGSNKIGGLGMKSSGMLHMTGGGSTDFSG